MDTKKLKSPDKVWWHRPGFHSLSNQPPATFTKKLSSYQLGSQLSLQVKIKPLGLFTAWCDSVHFSYKILTCIHMNRPALQQKKSSEIY